MSQTNSPQKPTSVNDVSWPEGLLSGDGAIANVMRNMQATFGDNFRALSDETLQFVKRRLEHNGQAIEQYRDCKDTADLLSAQQKWLMELARDYYDEVVRMGEVARKIFANALPMNGQATVLQKGEKRPHG